MNEFQFKFIEIHIWMMFRIIVIHVCIQTDFEKIVYIEYVQLTAYPPPPNNTFVAQINEKYL